MDIGFIHIGMMKTATTYMQNIWLRDEAYCLSCQGTLPFVLELRENVRNGLLYNSTNKQIQLDLPYKSGQKIVVSNEGFSTAYINQVAIQDKIPDFIVYTSKCLSDLAKMTQNILLVVRDPIAWLRSVFVQSIKQGGSGNFKDFITQQNFFVKHSLDLEHIVGSYEKYFSNVLILPYEFFKKDEAGFWQAVSDNFSVPTVSVNLNSQVNTSLSDERTFLLSELNGMTRILIETLDKASTYTNSNEKKQLISRFANDSKWVFRRFMEHADEQELETLKTKLNGLGFQDGYFNLEIPEELLTHIEKKFIRALRGRIDDCVLDSYL